MAGLIEAATRIASAKWKEAFNKGDAAGCAACYEADAKMVASPFGTFVGKSRIQEFWHRLIAEGFADVAYVDPRIEVIDQQSAVLTAKWTMNKAQGLIIRELWVLQPDGTALLREDHFKALQ